MTERSKPVPITYPADDGTCGSALLNMFEPTDTVEVIVAAITSG